MIRSIGVAPDLSDHGEDKRRDQDEPARKHPPSAPASIVEADIRLLIEPDPSGEGLVYVTIDRTTGRVISRLRREDAARMGDNPNYSAGGLLKTTA